MITLNRLKKSFGEKVAVDIPEFTINDGDILGLVGNNGAGKTTLFRLILDLIKADEGTVSIGGINPTESEEWKQTTGSYIDEGFLIDFLTPEEYFEFLGKVNNMPKDAVEAREKDFEQFMAGEIMEQKKLIRDFSAGNKQKIGIISALFNRPKLVILDEPFNFLDPSSQNILKKILMSYARENEATVLISSHNLQHTIEISTRIALLEHGVILKDLQNEQGSAEKELEDYFNI
ncbi:ABC transporter ATP-binding protein [Prevotella sp. KH2C16]|uniref:ABC transporter ATP-binding protein n=1 Tax=Prevotella sp. KH2C16 TaxID=1855325 RepID=UPI0008F2696E|nr:ABC transporter ATP-binding protein [Prevotella sp. KH2C16]SFG22571.1 ABC-2 type transport system ATP-binding protein [Prevotella sp. KH2C16]